jgi:outer membrane protein TolC
MVALATAMLPSCATIPPIPVDDALRDALRGPEVTEEHFRVASAPVRDHLTPVPIDLQNGLSPDEAALVAVAVNPALQAIRDNRGIQHAQVTQAGILPNPTAVGGADFITDGSPMALMGTQTGYAYGLQWNLSPILSLPTGVEAETLGVEAVELDIAWQEWQVAQAARLAAGRLIFIQRRLTIAEDTEHEFTELLDTLTAAEAQGNATVLDVGAARAAQQQATLDRLQVLQQLRLAQLDLLTALGVTPLSPLVVDFAAPPPTWANRPTLDAVIDALPDQRLDLLALQRGYRSQDRRVTTQTIRAFPPVVVGITRGVDTGGVGTVGFNVSIDLPFFDRNQGNIELATATETQLYDEYLARVQSARFDVANAMANLTSLDEQIAILNAYIPSLEHLIELGAQEVGRGNVSLIDLYDLRVRRLTFRLALASLLQNQFEIGIALDIAAGVLLADRAPTTGATP